MSCCIGCTCTDRWLEFVGPDGLCGLCGNTGKINTRGGKVRSPRGRPAAGIEAFCICPNGRAMKEQSRNGTLT